MAFPASAFAAGIEVDVTVSKKGGEVRCALYADSIAKAFPKDPENATAQVVGERTGEKATCRFDEVAPGTYAVSVLHDVNSNGDLDSNMLGIPKEPLGFSNGAKPKRGPPSFDAAKFTHGSEATKLQIKTE